MSDETPTLAPVTFSALPSSGVLSSTELATVSTNLTYLASAACWTTTDTTTYAEDQADTSVARKRRRLIRLLIALMEMIVAAGG